MNGNIFLLRAFELGIRLDDLEQMSMGEIADLLIEKANDSFEYPYKATQADINRL